MLPKYSKLLSKYLSINDFDLPVVFPGGYITNAPRESGSTLNNLVELWTGCAHLVAIPYEPYISPTLLTGACVTLCALLVCMILGLSGMDRMCVKCTCMVRILDVETTNALLKKKTHIWGLSCLSGNLLPQSQGWDLNLRVITDNMCSCRH